MTEGLHKARYERTVFHNEQNDYCVLQMKTDDRTIPPKARARYRYNDGLIRFTVVGYGLPRTGAIELELDGEWQETKYGLQLAVETWEEIIPLTIEGIRAYLACGLIKGIGEKTAAEIVARFGLESLTVIEWTPEKLLEIRGITEGRLAEIKDGFAESRSLRSLMMYLAPYNVSATTAQRIQQFFGSSAAATIRERPFELCKVPGFGFVRVDEIARKIGCRPNEPLRIRGAIIYVLTERQKNEGHLYAPVEDLCKATYELLNENIPPNKRVEPKEVSDVLCAMAADRTVIADGGIYMPNAYYNEVKAAKKITELMTAPHIIYSVDAAIADAKAELGIVPSPQQENAVKMAFKNSVSIITGSPGTGKTTVLQLVIAVFHKLNPNGKIALSASTGRASYRMTESTGVEGAETLHSVLGILTEEIEMTRPQNDECVDADFIIVDEFSMVDMWLASKFFGRIKPGTTVLLVGDMHQLPSVGAGNVFRELIECGRVPVTVLAKIFRQAEGSRIAYNAKRINDDDTRLQYGEDFTFDDCAAPFQAAQRIQEIYLDEVARLGVENVQILSPYKTDGDASAINLNASVRELVNPFVSYETEVRIGANLFRIGDRVMQTKNTEKVTNGDLGFVRGIIRDGDTVKVSIEFTGGRFVEYTTKQMSHVELASAMTIHKAMGSEFGVIIIPVLMAHNTLLNRNLLYTAVTRAKLRVHLVGQRKALIIAIHRQKINKRNTQLGSRIVHYLKRLSYEDERIAG